MSVIHLDVDGVLADFVRGACEVHGRQWDGVTWDLQKLWKMSARKFWEPLGPQFFLTLPKTKEADEIVRIVEKYEFLFVTSPPRDLRVFSAKAIWLAKHWPQHERRICICAKKHLIGGGILIDDSEANCDMYKGTAIRWPCSDLEIRLKEILG